MMKFPVNAPCFCGSEKKFKKCHKGRENEISPELRALIEECTTLFNQKYCSHPSSGSRKCNKIIKAHTIPKSQSIATIAENGHVCTIKENIFDVIKKGFVMTPKK